MRKPTSSSRKGPNASVDPPTALDDISSSNLNKEPTSPLKSPSCFEESWKVLNRGMGKTPIVDVGVCYKEATGGGSTGSDGNGGNKDTASLLDMFKKLETHYSTEKATWEKNFYEERQKKSSYKNQLKEEYKKRLCWLEKQLDISDAGQCCSETSDRSQAQCCSIPPIQRTETASTQETSSGSERENRRSPRRALSPKQLQGYEVSFQASHAVQRVHELEKQIKTMTRKHEKERNEWIQTLDEAAKITEKGEQLSAQQEYRLLELKAQLSTEHRSQKEKFKEQIRVLKDLLDLTEQQLISERKDWEGEVSIFEVTCERLAAEKVELKEQALKAEKELADLKKEFELLNRNDSATNYEKTAFEETISKLVAEKTHLERQVSSLKQHLKVVSESKRTTSFGVSPLSPKLRIEWEDKLNRAIVDRDLFQQEAKHTKALLEAERQQREAIIEEEKVKQRSIMEEKLNESRKHFKNMLDSKEHELERALKELVDERQSFKERIDKKFKEWEIETRRQILEIQEVHAAEMRELDSPDHDLLEKYQNAVDSRNEVIFKLRKFEQQRSEEKCTWKLQLESALAELRAAKDRMRNLEAEHEHERLLLTKETEDLRKSLAQSKVDFVRELSELTVSKSLADSHSIQAAEEKIVSIKEELECKLAVLRESHAKELSALRESHAKELSSFRENHAMELSNLRENHAIELSRLDRELLLCQESNTVLKAEVEEIKNVRDQSKDENQSLACQLNDAESENDILSTRLADLEKRIATADHVIAERTEQCRDLKYLLEEAQTKLRDAVDRSNRKETKFRSQKNEVMKEALEMASELDDARAQIKHLQSQLECVQNDCHSLSHRREDYEAKLRTVSEERDKYKLEALELLKQDERNKEEIVTLKEKASDMARRLQAALEEEEKQSGKALDYATRMGELKEEMRNLKRLLDEQSITATAKEQELQTVNSLHEKSSSEAERLRREVESLEKKLCAVSNLEKEVFTWRERASKSDAEARVLGEQLDKVTNQLSALQSIHNQAEARWEARIDYLEYEKDRLKSDSESYGRLCDSPIANLLVEHHGSICKAVEELRKDMVSVREMMESSNRTDKAIEESNFGALRHDLGQIQITLDDVVAELTLETETMYETRNAVMKLANSPKEAQSEPHNGWQEKLFVEIAELRESLKLNASGQGDGAADDVILKAELHKKDIVLAKCQAELELLRKDLMDESTKREDIERRLKAELRGVKEHIQLEIERRERAEAEVATLNDHADAYTEELMHLQADNARLQASLTEAECRMTEVLAARACPADPEDDDEFSLENVLSGNDDSSPLLEEALALAQGLTDIVKGEGDTAKHSNVLSILHSLSEMMDDHDRDESISTTGRDQPPSCSLSAKPKPNLTIDVGEGANIISSQAGRPEGLQALVEQLYARCQTLERERLEMMDSTLDLLEKTRSASKAEVEAAITTARRSTMEELIRLRKQNYVEREKLYHRLCSNFVSKQGARG